MKTAWLDCTYGISGDMTLGALIDAGAPLEELRAALATLSISDYAIELKKVARCGVRASHIVVTTGEHHPHRKLSDILGIIDCGSFSDRVKSRAWQAFSHLAEAEASVHGSTIDAVHFHEVGAVDAIVDIIGAMWCLEQLQIEHVSASIVSVGNGTVKSAHGVLPVPAPATAKLLVDVPLQAGPLPGELTTPTGAAILKTVCESFGPMPPMTLQKVGYGAGSRETAGHTNYLRVMLGEARGVCLALPLEKRALVVLETEIDDMSPEVYGYVLQRLFDAGCLDAFMIPIYMKKNRPGVSLHVLCAHDQMNALIELIMKETTTFGVKAIPCERFALPREIIDVDTPYGAIRVKVGRWDNTYIKASPEYEDCRRAAEQHNVPITKVFAAAIVAAEGTLYGD